MNKLTKTEYIKLIAETGNLDTKVAKDILKALERYLFFRPDTMETRKEYNAWKRS